MSIILSALKTEILTDPASLGYAAQGGDQGAMANLINARTSSQSVTVTNVTNISMQQSVIGTEYADLPATAQRAWGALVGLDTVPVCNTNIRAQIQAIWSAGTTTRANLVALQTRDGSRAEVLFGEGVRVHHLDIAAALGS